MFSHNPEILQNEHSCWNFLLFYLSLNHYIYSALIINEGIHPWLHATSSWTMAFNSNQNPYDNAWPSVTPSSRWRPPYLFFVPAPPWREPPPRKLFTRGWWRYLQAGSVVVITLVVPQSIANLHILLGRHDGMKSHVVSSACRWCPPSIFKISEKVVVVKQGSECYRKIFQHIPKIPTIYTSFWNDESGQP